MCSLNCINTDFYLLQYVRFYTLNVGLYHSNLSCFVCYKFKVVNYV